MMTYLLIGVRTNNSSDRLNKIDASLSRKRGEKNRFFFTVSSVEVRMRFKTHSAHPFISLWLLKPEPSTYKPLWL